MKFRWLIIIALFLIGSIDEIIGKGNIFINPYPRYKHHNDGGDSGEPLFLTPFINSINVTNDKVRQMARVHIDQFNDVESYSGYLTVNEYYGSNMFFWYFPAEENTINSPVVLWLQGGPGASSLFGLFVENGPFEMLPNCTLVKRKYTWSKNMNMIYIDNPVGTGFSFTNDDEGYSQNERNVALNLYNAVTQLYQLFEWSMLSSFWITGESYAGKYVPALAYYIHKIRISIDPKISIPLKGIAIGNGFSDPIHQLNYGDYLLQLGLIDENGLKQFKKMEAKGLDFIKTHHMNDAFDVFDNLLNGDVSNSSLFRNLTGLDSYYNFLNTKDDGTAAALGKYLQSSATRRAIHVGNSTFHDVGTINKVEQHLKADVMDTVAPMIAELLDYYKVCTYNGQLDIIVAYTLTRNYLSRLKFKNNFFYHNATRTIWREDDEIAGYVKHGGNLIDVMVRNAGHMAPRDQPKWMFNLINQLISGHFP